LQEQKLIKNTIKYLKETSPKKLSKQFTGAHSLYEILKRPEVKLSDILPKNKLVKLSDNTINKIEILVKFDGYIKNQQSSIDKFYKYDNISLTSISDYKALKNLSLEAIDKLNKVKPLTMGQAHRISGINLTDLMIIKYYLDSHK
jgi:tRNA uridine 5-carboxymethylaminomethyl modification enzyme